MKAIMRNMGCRQTRREIEEADYTEQVSLGVDAHLKSCGECEKFYDDQLKLRQIVSSLDTVAAPGDFEFRLRARLAGEKRSAKQSFMVSNFSFGRATAFASVLLLIGSAVLVLSLRGGNDGSQVASGPNDGAQPAVTQPQNPGSAVANNGEPSPDIVNAGTTQAGDDNANPRPAGLRPRGPRGSQQASAKNRISTREEASTAANVLKPDNLVAAAGHSVFPIEASPEAMKVSLGNGRGAPKTISVPGVSFGSQRVLAQNPSPLLASSRGAW